MGKGASGDGEKFEWEEVDAAGVLKLREVSNSSVSSSTRDILKFY